MKFSAIIPPALATFALIACVQVTGETECLDGECDDAGRRSTDARSSRGDSSSNEPDTITLADGREVPVEPDLISNSRCDERSCEEVIAAGEVPRDTDGDGFVDCEEGLLDVDGDGLANCEDPDSDDDGINDRDEGTGDTDGDGVSDAYDDDADGDGIVDRYEGTNDPDEDGIPNYLDDDSDGDGIPDSVEYGRTASNPGPPVDRDGDGVADYLDLDSDGDGLADADEAVGCPTTSQRDLPDSDGDNYSDLVELAFGSDPCNPGSDIRTLVDFYFELPFNGP